MGGCEGSVDGWEGCVGGWRNRLWFLCVRDFGVFVVCERVLCQNAKPSKSMVPLLSLSSDRRNLMKRSREMPGRGRKKERERG